MDRCPYQEKDHLERQRLFSDLVGKNSRVNRTGRISLEYAEEYIFGNRWKSHFLFYHLITVVFRKYPREISSFVVFEKERIQQAFVHEKNRVSNTKI
jgi:hypothetical protein